MLMKGRPWDKEQSIRFWGDLLFDVDPVILFLHCRYAVCKKNL